MERHIRVKVTQVSMALAFKEPLQLSKPQGTELFCVQAKANPTWQEICPGVKLLPSSHDCSHILTLESAQCMQQAQRYH